MTKQYELSSLISSQLSEEEIKAFLDKISSMVSAEGGESIEVKNSIRKRVGYPIKHERQAWFSVVNFEMEPEKLENLQTKIKDFPEILRFMVTNRRPASETMPTIDEFRKPVTKQPESNEPKEENFPKQPKEEKVELEDIDKKLEEILGEN